MVGNFRKPLVLSATLAALIALAGCSPTGFGRSAPVVTAPTAPAPIQPVQTGSVQTSDLPPLGGSRSLSSSNSSTTLPGNTAATGDGFDTASTSSPGFMLDDVGSPGNTTGGRDLSGNVTMQQLLGGWTVMVGANQCRLNLTYTAKGATGRYRASTPGCADQTMAGVTSWQLLGNQIQLYDESDALVGTLLKSGNRFVGTLAGGQTISMVG